MELWAASRFILRQPNMIGVFGELFEVLLVPFGCPERCYITGLESDSGRVFHMSNVLDIPKILCYTTHGQKSQREVMSARAC